MVILHEFSFFNVPTTHGVSSYFKGSIKLISVVGLHGDPLHIDYDKLEIEIFFPPRQATSLEWRTLIGGLRLLGRAF